MRNSLQTLQEFNLQLLYPHPPGTMYKIIADYAQQLSGADSCSIFLQKNGKLRRVFTNVPKERRIQPRPNGYNFLTLKTGDSYFYSAKELEQYHPELNGAINSIAIVPIKFHTKRVGTITLQITKLKRFKKNALKSLEILSGATSLAIEKAEILHELKKAVKARDLFISAAAHELKTPLTVVQLYAKSISNALVNNTEIDHAWIEKILRHASLLNRVVEDFLQTDATTKKLHLRNDHKPVHFAKLVEQIIETARKLYPDRTITFVDKTMQKEIIMADSGRITQLVNNLLNNARKFSSPQKPINVELCRIGQDICIDVQDHGQGIKKQDMNFLFNRYFQGADNKTKGMGIGLYVCKIITEEHDGMIQIYSKEKKGTKVSVYLPVN